MTHETNAGPVTLINVFEVHPDKLESFLAGWRDRAELMSKRPGFRSLGCTARYPQMPVSR